MDFPWSTPHGLHEAAWWGPVEGPSWSGLGLEGSRGCMDTSTMPSPVLGTPVFIMCLCKCLIQSSCTDKGPWKTRSQNLQRQPQRILHFSITLFITPLKRNRMGFLWYLITGNDTALHLILYFYDGEIWVKVWEWEGRTCSTGPWVSNPGHCDQDWALMVRALPGEQPAFSF